MCQTSQKNSGATERKVSQSRPGAFGSSGITSGSGVATLDGSEQRSIVEEARRLLPPAKPAAKPNPQPVARQVAPIAKQETVTPPPAAKLSTPSIKSRIGTAVRSLVQPAITQPPPPTKTNTAPAAGNQPINQADRIVNFKAALLEAKASEPPRGVTEDKATKQARQDWQEAALNSLFNALGSNRPADKNQAIRVLVQTADKFKFTRAVLPKFLGGS